jgi:CMP-N,N'-diacetyllegionaminic acid synthase
LPGKNMRLLGGKPLLAWTIDGLLEAALNCPVLLSTDDPVMAEFGRDADVLVPWLRPPELSTATATSVDVAIHALDWFERENGPVDGLMLLQPTSPFRSPMTIRCGAETFAKAGGRAVVAMSPARHTHPWLTYRLDGNAAVPFIMRRDQLTRSQDLPPALHINGCLYVASPSQIRDQRTFVGDRPVPLIVENPVESIDIDDEFDFQVAEAMLKRG